MTNDIELLPLPDWMEWLSQIGSEDIRDYARACVAHATAAKDAEIEALREQIAAADYALSEATYAHEAALEDAERYRWLRMMAKEQLLNPKAAGSECPDMRTYWRIPTLICSGPLGGFIDFDDAIDQARGKVGE